MTHSIPRHIAIVMDGNGRWAQQRGLPRMEGHKQGVKSVKTVIRACLSQGVAVLSLFAFSSENWSRPQAEVNFLMQLFLEALAQEVEELHANGIRLRFTGDRSPLLPELQTQMQHSELLTADNDKLILNIVVNYGGKWDITQASRQLFSEIIAGNLSIDDINDEVFAQKLNTHGLIEPDLFIRTSGEQRISNFFLWQLAYTELYFTEVHWPDFSTEVFQQAIDCYAARERRYGQVAEESYA